MFTQVILKPAYNFLFKIDVTFFPYDVQTCEMKFGGWSHDGFHLSLIPFIFGNQSFINITEPADEKGMFLMHGMDLSYFQK